MVILNAIMERNVFIIMVKMDLKKIVNVDIIKMDKDIVHFRLQGILKLGKKG